jgi:hypothetical protein
MVMRGYPTILLTSSNGDNHRVIYYSIGARFDARFDAGLDARLSLWNAGDRIPVALRPRRMWR